jgi:hypothetical protein
MNRRLLIGGLIALALIGAGVPGVRNLVGPTHRSWTEDVLLEDGLSIVVKRSVTLNESNSWSGDAHNATELEATIAFTGELKGLPVWSVPLMALVLYRDAAAQGQWVVVATTTTCDVWSARGEPRPPYWEFRLGEAGWQETPLSASSLGRSTNLYLRYNILKARHVTVGDRERANQIAAPRYLDVLATAKSNCWSTQNSPTSAAPTKATSEKGQ